jgi:hypothetical protein
MTKDEALQKAIRKFTNLYGGDVLPNVGVRTIINYYETLLHSKAAPVIKQISGIEKNFIEDEISEIEDDYENYYL